MKPTAISIRAGALRRRPAGPDSMQRLVALLVGLLASLIVPVAGRAQATAASAPTPSAVPVEHFFAPANVLDATLSPSGTRLAVRMGLPTGRIGLRVLDLGPPLKPGAAVGYQDMDVVSLQWASDERLVFTLRNLTEGSAEDRWAGPGLFSIKFDGTDARMLVRRKFPAFVTSGPDRSRALDPRHVLLQMPPHSAVADEIVMGHLSVAGQELESVRPLWLNVVTGHSRSMDLGDLGPLGDDAGHIQHWLFSPEGVPLAAMSMWRGQQAWYLRSSASTPWHRIGTWPLGRGAFEPQQVDANGRLFVRVREGAAGLAQLTVYDETLKAPRLPAMVAVPGFDFLGRVLLGSKTQRVLGYRVEGDGEETVWQDDAMKRMQALADARWPHLINRLSCSRCGEADMRVLVRSYSDREPGRLALYDAAGAQWTFLGPMRDNIQARDMARVRLHRVTARDGRDLPVWLTLPHSLTAQGDKPPAAPAPAVVLVHGGPWLRDGFWRWAPMEQFLASRGYLVISPEFRGSAGYGSAHELAGFKQYGLAMQNDVADALLWAQRQGLAAPGRACIAGGGYGGYSTLMGLARHPELYRCGAAWAALTDLSLYVEGRWWLDDDISMQGREFFLPERVGDPVVDAALLRDNSPVNLARQIKAPVLLAMGAADRRVPLAHGKRMREALIEAGNPPEWIVYDDEAHSWRKPATWQDFARKLEVFLGRHLATSP